MALARLRLQRLYSAFEPLTSPTHCMLILTFILLQKVAPIAAPYEKRSAFWKVAVPPRKVRGPIHRAVDTCPISETGVGCSATPTRQLTLDADDCQGVKRHLSRAVLCCSTSDTVCQV